MAVPGASGLPSSDDLVAIWRSKGGFRFQNYRAIFTILDEQVIRRDWLTEFLEGAASGNNAPPSWNKWQRRGVYSPLQAQPSTGYRRKGEQLPEDAAGMKILEEIVGYFDQLPEGRFAFEPCAVAIAKLMMPDIVSANLTRPWRDGGRDAVGKFRIGGGPSSILVDFALEAKCKGPGANFSCGVKETSRLISRLRHRQFGIFVTTSCLNEQAYAEIVEDKHPVVVIAGRDIVQTLVRAGHKTPGEVRAWLEGSFPYSNPAET